MREPRLYILCQYISTKAQIAAHSLTTGLWRSGASHIEICVESGIYINPPFMPQLYPCSTNVHGSVIRDNHLRDTGMVSTFRHYAALSTPALYTDYPISSDQRPRVAVGFAKFPIR